MTTSQSLSRKLAIVLLLWVCAFTLPWVVQASTCVLLIIGRYTTRVLVPVSPRSAKIFDRFVAYSVAVATVIILLNSILIKEGAISATAIGVPLYDEGLMFGARTASRLLLLSFSVLLFFISTPLTDLIHFLQERGLPPYLVLVLLLTLHFLDQVPAKIHRIFLAQQARGAPVDSGLFSRTQALFSILSPLVLSSIVESIERGTALELRGFLQKTERVVPTNRSTARADWLVIILVLVAAGLLVYGITRWLLV